MVPLPRPDPSYATACHPWYIYSITKEWKIWAMCHSSRQRTLWLLPRHYGRTVVPQNWRIWSGNNIFLYIRLERDESALCTENYRVIYSGTVVLRVWVISPRRLKLTIETYLCDRTSWRPLGNAACVLLKHPAWALCFRDYLSRCANVPYQIGQIKCLVQALVLSRLYTY